MAGGNGFDYQCFGQPRACQRREKECDQRRACSTYRGFVRRQNERDHEYRRSRDSIQEWQYGFELIDGSAEVATAFETLSIEERLIIQLRQRGYTQAEIGDMVGMNPRRVSELIAAVRG